ncbi:hypothetical protein LEMLEM_LOCUS23168 [Lemmus lemmus]
MENLLKLCLFLLCFETGFILALKIISFSLSSSTDNKLESAEMRCTKFCKFNEKYSGGLTIHTFCCDSEDFCNDIDLPMVMT